MKKLTGAVIQARVSSSRFPGKVLKELPYGSGITVLEQVIKRVKRVKGIDVIVLATTKEQGCRKIIDIAGKCGVKYVQGDTKNVLSRYYKAAKMFSLDRIVRITSDCPCVDPEIVSSIIKAHEKNHADYTSNSLNGRFPNGVEAEVFNFDVLEEANARAKKACDKEHVTSYIYGHPGKFNLIDIKPGKAHHAPDIRITLDTEPDYALLSVVFDHLYNKDPYFNTKDIIDLYRKKPWLGLINSKVFQKKIFHSLKEEMKELMRMSKTQDMARAYRFLKGLSLGK